MSASVRNSFKQFCMNSVLNDKLYPLANNVLLC